MLKRICLLKVKKHKALSYLAGASTYERVFKGITIAMSKHAVPIIVDIEASGFGANSYPIEVGLVFADGSRYCRLIKPAPEWRSWSDEAERVHGISKEVLAERGVPYVEVAKDLNRLLSGKIVYSDGWVVDEPWLITLFNRAGISREFYISDIMTIMNETGLSMWHQVKNEVLAQYDEPRHRASFDALVVQETFCRVRERLQIAS